MELELLGCCVRVSGPCPADSETEFCLPLLSLTVDFHDTVVLVMVRSVTRKSKHTLILVTESTKYTSLHSMERFLVRRYRGCFRYVETKRNLELSGDIGEAM